MRSVGIPEVESEHLDTAPTVDAEARGEGLTIVVVAIVLVGALLWWGLGALAPTNEAVGESLGPSSDVDPPLPSTTTAPVIAEDVPVPEASIGIGQSPRPEILGARVLREAVPEWPVVSSETGFVKIGTEGGQRTALISPNGLWWDSNLAVPMNGIDYEDPLAAIDVSPDWRHSVAIFRSPSGFLVTRSTDNGAWLPPVTIEAPATASIRDFVVGSAIAYVSIDGPAVDPSGADGPAFMIGLDGDLDVHALDPYPGFPELAYLDGGTTFSDGTVAARGIGADGVIYLMHLLDNGDVSIGQFDAEWFRTARLVALGTTLVVVEPNETTSLLRFDLAPTNPFDFSLDPQLSASNGDVLVSIGTSIDGAVLLAWFGESTQPTEIALGSSADIDEIVAFNTNEVLLATTTPDGQRWLANVPLGD